MLHAARAASSWASETVVVPEGSGVLRTVEGSDAQDDTAGDEGHGYEGVDVAKEPLGQLGVLGEPARCGFQVGFQHGLPLVRDRKCGVVGRKSTRSPHREEGAVVADAMDHRTA